MKVQKLEVDFKQSDERGTISQILHSNVCQINYLFTKKGTKRGKHYHKKNKEYFYIIKGAVALHAEFVDRGGEMEDYLFQTGDLFIIETFTMHDFTFLEDTQMIVAYNYGVEQREGKDIYTE